jgi:hypothetical protein
MRMIPVAALAAAASLAGALAQPVSAQQPAAAPAVQVAQPLDVGAVAPDFALPGSTRFGLLRQPVRLSDYRGKTVVLAFYFRSRSRG